MTILASAYRRILHSCAQFSLIKRANQPDDIVKIIRFERDTENGSLELTPIKDSIHMHEMIEDPNITKVYCSDTILDQFRYLAFIQLGIEYLIEHDELESASIGREVLNEKMMEEINKLQR